MRIALVINLLPILVPTNVLGMPFLLFVFKTHYNQFK